MGQITLIRANNPQAIPLVAGFDWAYDLTPSGEFAKAAMHGEIR